MFTVKTFFSLCNIAKFSEGVTITLKIYNLSEQNAFVWPTIECITTIELRSQKIRHL